MIEKSVQVRQQVVPDDLKIKRYQDADTFTLPELKNLSDDASAVRKRSRILVLDKDSVVVPAEGVECPQLVPPDTQLLSGVSDESTDICSDHGNTKLVELEHADDGEVKVVPLGPVVPQPVGSPPARPDKC